MRQLHQLMIFLATCIWPIHYVRTLQPWRKCSIEDQTCFTGLPCKVQLSQEASCQCQSIRYKELLFNRVFYKLSTQPSNANEKSAYILAPVLNQTTDDTQKHGRLNPFVAHFLNIRVGTKKLSLTLSKIEMKKIGSKSFKKYDDYIQVWKTLVKGMQGSELSPYYKFSTQLQQFLLEKENWRKDKYFVQQRLAGLNPLSIKAITWHGTVGSKWSNLLKKLNPKFKWETAIRDEVGVKSSLRKMMAKRLLYVVDYPMFKDIPTLPDVLSKFQPAWKTMQKDTNPILILAVCQHKWCRGELKPVAIQEDAENTSNVHTPGDGYKWELAKAQLQHVDGIISNFYYHLAITHVRIDPICIAIERHLSKYHPLHQIFKFHTRGTMEVNRDGLDIMLDATEVINKLYSIGNIGATKLMNRAYVDMTLGDNDLIKDIKRRGVDNKESLPYYPYRDDGKVIVDVLNDFSKDITDLYYDTDEDVQEDFELQDMINHLSAKGRNPPDGGNGKIRGLPNEFNRKAQLANFIKQVLWIVVQHSAINYPGMDYNAFTPIMPTKLFSYNKVEANKDIINNLGGGLMSLVQSTFYATVGSLHYDELFDYAPHLTDVRARKLVHRNYMLLKSCIKKLLDKRNQKRLAKGQLMYPYFVPGFMTNSICT